MGKIFRPPRTVERTPEEIGHLADEGDKRFEEFEAKLVEGWQLTDEGLVPPECSIEE